MCSIQELCHSWNQPCYVYSRKKDGRDLFLRQMSKIVENNDKSMEADISLTHISPR